ncbi:MAG: OmpA family protein [Fibrobacteres bacterium]|jgi:chemotaxis protein MotB|nr:OmpA family protein [Fibrobacterota bacterium]
MAIAKHPNRHRVHEPEHIEEDWLMSYADMVTLLMAFFLAMLSVSHVDPVLFEQMKKGLRSDIGKDKDVKTPLGEIKHDLDSLLASERARGDVNIDLGREGIILEFSSSAVFDPGKADVGPAARANMDKVADAIKNIEYYKFAVDIEGHTDNIPIKTLQFPSNWELSVMRATNIVKYLIGKGIPSERLKAAGYADTKPKTPNVDAEGKPIPANQAKNRRIVLKIH